MPQPGEQRLLASRISRRQHPHGFNEHRSAPIASTIHYPLRRLIPVSAPDIAWMPKVEIAPLPTSWRSVAARTEPSGTKASRSIATFCLKSGHQSADGQHARRPSDLAYAQTCSMASRIRSKSQVLSAARAKLWLAVSYSWRRALPRAVANASAFQASRKAMAVLSRFARRIVTGTSHASRAFAKRADNPSESGDLD